MDELHEITRRLGDIELKFKHALDAAEVGIWEWNVKTGDLYWDDQMLNIYGISRKEFKGKYEDFSSKVHPEDIISVEKQIDDCLNDDTPYIYRFRVKGQNGDWKWVKGKGNVCRDRNGEPVTMSGVNLECD